MHVLTVLPTQSVNHINILLATIFGAADVNGPFLGLSVLFPPNQQSSVNFMHIVEIFLESLEGFNILKNVTASEWVVDRIKLENDFLEIFALDEINNVIGLHLVNLPSHHIFIQNIDVDGRENFVDDFVDFRDLIFRHSVMDVKSEFSVVKVSNEVISIYLIFSEPLLKH